MLGNIGQIASLMRNSGKIQQGMKDLQERLAAARFVGEAGAGQVAATVDGKGELIAIKIESLLTRSGDAELLEDLIVAAVRDAVGKSRVGAQKEMASLAEGLGLPPNLLSG